MYLKLAHREIVTGIKLDTSGVIFAGKRHGRIKLICEVVLQCCA